MKVINIKKFGGPEMLEISARERPEPSADQILIKVAAAGINRPDIVQRKGHYPPPPGASDIPGLECAGVIVEIGQNVMNWKVGDKVCALLTGGGYAEYALAHQGCVLPVPNGYSLEQAAALPETYFTVWSNLFDRAKLKAGETVLIHGGTSGIGTTAIQMAKISGATVITTSGTDEKCDICKSIGADHAINYKTQDFCQETIKLTDGKGADVILDMVAGDYVAKNISALNEDGRTVIIAVQGGIKADINVLPIMTKRLTVTGSTLRPRDNDFKSAIAKSLKENIWPLLETGKIAPIIDKIFPLEQAAEAHRYLESGDHTGKIILKV
ncbi:MAG: NAD(P)H-quinone oxidoreductase [Alphaproteobacteria bacterium]|nr:NAD(P)H-quinone oxidoreductase [Alphaproteobacteria bacterium]HPF47720.1 NAD(P)H-quinone oxidoreductase [Emcibacteraceae bacterium]